mmetsp:Transcript_4445/g.17497  ORF Transcript_4445/g.17497 Transcript_4445/m.17497 type:complete len:292 (+) Transcript_4445:155-1030(+)
MGSARRQRTAAREVFRKRFILQGGKVAHHTHEVADTSRPVVDGGDVQLVPEGLSVRAVVEHQLGALLACAHRPAQTRDCLLVRLRALQEAAVPPEDGIPAVSRRFQEARGGEDDGVVRKVRVGDAEAMLAQNDALRHVSRLHRALNILYISRLRVHDRALGRDCRPIPAFFSSLPEPAIDHRFHAGLPSVLAGLGRLVQNVVVQRSQSRVDTVGPCIACLKTTQQEGLSDAELMFLLWVDAHKLLEVLPGHAGPDMHILVILPGLAGASPPFQRRRSGDGHLGPLLGCVPY